MTSKQSVSSLSQRRLLRQTFSPWLLLFLMVAAPGCGDADSTSAAGPTLPPTLDAGDVRVVYASRERQPPLLFTGDYDPLWGDLVADAPIVEELLNAMVLGLPVDPEATSRASNIEIVTIVRGWGREEEEVEAIDGRAWISDHSLTVNVVFNDGTVWSARQVIGCDVKPEGILTGCRPMPDHWELLHRDETVLSKALTEWFQHIEEYMPQVAPLSFDSMIPLDEPFTVSGAGHHRGDRVVLDIEFSDGSVRPLGEVLLDHGRFRWDGEITGPAPTGYTLIGMTIMDGTERVGGMTRSGSVLSN